MPSSSLDQAHKRAREALDATGCAWNINGKRMAYVGTLTTANGTPLRVEGKSQLDTMRALHAAYQIAASTAA